MTPLSRGVISDALTGTTKSVAAPPLRQKIAVPVEDRLAVGIRHQVVLSEKQHLDRDR